MMRSRWLSVTPLAILLFTGLWTAQAAPAAVVCSIAERSVFFIEFSEGGAALAPDVHQRFLSHMLPRLSDGRYVDSYYVLASGDIAEGANWEQASANARVADQALARKRIDVLQAMIGSQASVIGSAPIKTHARENKQILSAAEQAASPEITAQTKAGIVATTRQRSPVPAENQPIPTC